MASAWSDRSWLAGVSGLSATWPWTVLGGSSGPIGTAAHATTAVSPTAATDAISTANLVTNIILSTPSAKDATVAGTAPAAIPPAA